MIEAFSPSCGTKYLLLHYPISMADQYGLTLEDYIGDKKLLSDARYSQGMLILDLLFVNKSLRGFQAVIATLMVYDIINLIPQQVRLSMCKQRFHTSLLS